MSVRSEKAAAAPTNALAALDVSDTAAAPTPEALAEGNNFCVANPENPLKRNLVVSIKATLNDFCLQKTRGSWAPTQEALRSMFQQRKVCDSCLHSTDGHRSHMPLASQFTSLDGAAEPMGDLKSVVLHKMEINHVKSTFPMTLGTRVTGVDDCTYSSTGEAFSAIVLPNCESSRVTDLQADDVSLAYEFAKKVRSLLPALLPMSPCAWPWPPACASARSRCRP